MQPDNQTPADYLDQIAAQPRTDTMSPLMLWGLIGGGLLIAVFFVVILFSSSGPSKTERFTGYVQRVQSLRSVVSDSAQTIQSSQLRSHNSTLGTLLGGAEQGATTFIGQYDLKEMPEIAEGSSLAIEFSELTSTLDDARLNAVFDRTYAREMAWQLGQLRSELQILYDGARDNDFQEYLVETDKNIEPLVKRFSEFNDTGA